MQQMLNLLRILALVLDKRIDEATYALNPANARAVVWRRMLVLGQDLMLPVGRLPHVLPQILRARKQDQPSTGYL